MLVLLDNGHRRKPKESEKDKDKDKDKDKPKEAEKKTTAYIHVGRCGKSTSRLRLLRSCTNADLGCVCSIHGIGTTAE